MENEKRLMHHTLLLGGSTAISKIAVFFLMPLYTAYLSPADFGAVDILVSTAILLIPLISLNMPEAVFRFGAGGEKEGAVFSSGALLTLVGFSLLTLGLPFFGLSSLLAPYRYLLFGYVAASLFRSFLAHYVRGRGEYGLFALQQLICVALTTALELLFLTIFRWGVRGYLAAIVLADAVTGTFLLFCIKPWRLFSWRSIDRGLAQRMLRYALPLIPTGILWWVMSVSDRYVLLHYQGEAVTGLYAAAGRIPAVLSLGITVFMEAWHYAALREKENRAQMFARIYGALLPVCFLIASVLIVSAKPVIAHLYAPIYGAAAQYVPPLTVAALLSGVVTFLGSVYTIQLRSFSSFLTTLAGSTCNLVLNFWWIPSLGAMGAALATVFAYFLIFVLRALHVRRLLPFDTRICTVTGMTAGLLAVCLLSYWHFYTIAVAICAVAGLLLWREWRAVGELLRQFFPFFAKKPQKNKR